MNKKYSFILMLLLCLFMTSCAVWGGQSGFDYTPGAGAFTTDNSPMTVAAACIGTGLIGLFLSKNPKFWFIIILIGVAIA